MKVQVMQINVNKYKYVLASVAFVTVLGANVSTGVSAATDQPAAKVYVCKYVSTPNVSERPQTGQNPIHVSSHAVKGYQNGNKKFNDAQSQSMVIDAPSDGSEPTCPTGEQPTTQNPGTTDNGQVLGETTSATATPTATNGEVLADTGASTVLPSVLAIIIAFVAGFSAFGFRVKQVESADHF